MASPYDGDIEKNTEFAKRACRHVMNEGHAFFAPHLLYPQLLNDANTQERQAGLAMGLAVLPRCDELWCYGERISHGMLLYYTLNGIKSRTVGDGQHGTAQNRPSADKQGIILGSTGTKNKLTALVDTDDVHCLMIGASGVGKTAFFLCPNLEYACASEMSFLTTDTKGDLYRNYGAIARD